MDETSRRPITAEQWAHARAVSEGEPPTRGRVAGLLGCDVGAVYARARAEGWTRLDFRRQSARDAHRDFIECAAAEGPEGAGGDEDEPAVPAATEGRDDESRPDQPRPDEDPRETMARVTALLARRFQAVLQRLESGRRIDRTEIDGLVAMGRMIDRWETLATERARKEETRSDEELAGMLRIIDRRIVELAREEAGRLVAQHDFGGARRGDTE